MAAATPTAASASAVAAPPSILRRVIAFDTALSLRIHSCCRPVPFSLLKALEISGDGRFWFPIPIALLPLSSASGAGAAYSILLGLLFGFLLDLLLVGLIKHLVRRPRPVYNKGMSLTFAVDHWSFPSGHSSRVFFIAAFFRFSSASIRRVLLVDGPIAPARRWIEDYYDGELAELLVWIVSIWSVATSASRVLLGRHFVLDVVVGACLGVLEASPPLRSRSGHPRPIPVAPTAPSAATVSSSPESRRPPAHKGTFPQPLLTAASSTCGFPTGVPLHAGCPHLQIRSQITVGRPLFLLYSGVPRRATASSPRSRSSPTRSSLASNRRRCRAPCHACRHPLPHPLPQPQLQSRAGGVGCSQLMRA